MAKPLLRFRTGISARAGFLLVAALALPTGALSQSTPPPPAAPSAAPGAPERLFPNTEQQVLRATMGAVPMPGAPPATEVVRPLICPPQLMVFGRCPVLPTSPIVDTRIRVRH